MAKDGYGEMSCIHVVYLLDPENEEQRHNIQFSLQKWVFWFGTVVTMFKTIKYLTSIQSVTKFPTC